ncbi:AraC family transcriptional regulator [Flavobacterium sp. AED]|uniref:helix-turn-helix domain-containing protein n=1 Tax=Flavobacterium sp. AED TaxID=1423323 RepID=UPI00057CA8A5|nr:AraC family transcriptional regulator [Flavobacterium sp. AED]KIA86155.1 transcriptional regulator [Flavobacterium sp. AED]MDI1307368.1 AraC family transcriptional regulator [bacterium]
MDILLNYKLIKPEKSLADFVYCFSSLQNLSNIDEAVIIPNGKIDLLFSKTTDNKLRILLMGLENKPKLAKSDVSNFFAISFNPIAVEYIFQQSIADLLNSGKAMTDNFWDFSIDDLNDFDAFCKKASQKIHSLLPIEIDERKRKLFELIHTANGEISIKELSEKVIWSDRQINRYFNQQFGLSLKTYCNILRFQVSLSHIKEGRLFPQLNFTDQSHFIKEIKKLSGVSPKELFKNKNDRFLQFLVYNKQ